MLTPLVVDASVAMKWVVSERGSAQARALRAENVVLTAPEHLVGEVGNGLRQRVTQGLLSAHDARTACNSIEALELEFVGGVDRWLRALPAALRWQLTTYDALYLLLAADLGADLVTADGRLLAAARRHSLPVRPLLDS